MTALCFVPTGARLNALQVDGTRAGFIEPARPTYWGYEVWIGEAGAGRFLCYRPTVAEARHRLLDTWAEWYANDA